MDVSIGDEIAAVEVENGTHHHQLSKNDEYSSKTNCSNILDQGEMVIPGNCDDGKNPPGFFAGSLDSEGVDRVSTSALASVSPRCTRSVVQEFTLRNKSRQSNWHHLYQRAGVCLRDGSPEDAAHRSNTREISNVRNNVGCTTKSKVFGKRSSNNNFESGDEVSHDDVTYGFNNGDMSNVLKDVGCQAKSELVERGFLSNTSDKVEQLVTSSASLSLGGIKTKFLSTSGFTQYIVKATLKDKGVLCREPTHGGSAVRLNDQTHAKAAVLSSNNETIMPPHSGALLNSKSKTVISPHLGAQLGLDMPHSVDLMHPPLLSTLSSSHRKAFTALLLSSSMPSPAGAPLSSTMPPHSSAMLSMPPHSGLSPHPGALSRNTSPNPGVLSSFAGGLLSSNMNQPNLGSLLSSDTNQLNLGALLSSNMLPHSGAVLRSNREFIMPPSHTSAPSSSNREIAIPPSHVIPEHLHSSYPHDGVSLRELLNSGKNRLNKVQSMHIFKQIVDVVSNSHSSKVALLDLRPLYFKLFLSGEIMYLGSSVNETIPRFSEDVHHSQNCRNEKRPLEHIGLPLVSQSAKKRKSEDYTRPWIPYRSGITAENELNVKYGDSQYTGDKLYEKFKPDTNRTHSDPIDLHRSDPSELFLASDSSELKWYASPEECCTLSSNIYSLGVFLFELLCSFDSEKARGSAMLDLRNRILSPKFLAESPKEAGFCLWLLHPEPSSRPTAKELLNSDFIKGIQEPNRFSSSVKHKDDESDLLFNFLKSLKEQKNKHSSKLQEEIKVLEADIEKVARRQTKNSLLHEESLTARANVFSHKDKSSLGVNYGENAPFHTEERVMKNINQLESAYFSERSTFQHSNNEPTNSDVNELLEGREICNSTDISIGLNKSTDCLGAFFNGLCKYARYSKFKVRGTLRNGDLNSYANVICSLSFDRDEDYFAAAGVSKKIKIYDYHAFLNNSVDIHYPVTELSSKSKFSCISWNNYIGNYLASTDYDGVVKLWDAGTGQEISQYTEHSRRAWSVDFSKVDPTKLASGSDDCSVKLWNINEKHSLSTIRNIANVCCVQFSAKSSHLLAFGSANYKTYCYDLRNVSTPWCVLAGHGRAVSYVKFADTETLISASTDNTLKLWDLTKTSISALPNNGCITTFRGHINEKNFVGLSVANDGYIVCGSETNEVFAYYRSLPMPISSHKFGSVNPITGKETDDDGGHFVSSVCWRKESDMVVAANSTGSIKLLQLV